jgi:DNA polymerase IV
VSRPPPRSILHVDMDAFFVAVELLDRPELRGQPVVVGGSGARGVVAAASYEARAFGVHSAMPSVRARRLCPHAVFLPGRHDRYAEVSGDVMAIFGRFTPLVEPISLDEAFLDVTGAQRLHGAAARIARHIRDAVLEEQGLTCSVGVAPTKFVAKLASEAAKPLVTPRGPQPGPGVAVVEPTDVEAFLRPLPVRALWGVGPATLARLERLGVTTVGDLAALPRRSVTDALGTGAGRHMHALANGIDDRAVQPDRRPKSVGHEETFRRDLHRRDELDRELVRLCDAVASRLRHHDLGGRTITLKIRFHDFRTITRSATVAEPVDAGPTITRVARTLLSAVDPTPGVRLLGVHASGLVRHAARQLTLDDLLEQSAPSADDWGTASRAIDEIRDRFGSDAIGPASLTGRHGLRVKRQGDQQWGPDRPAGTEDAQASGDRADRKGSSRSR